DPHEVDRFLARQTDEVEGGQYSTRIMSAEGDVSVARFTTNLAASGRSRPRHRDDHAPALAPRRHSAPPRSARAPIALPTADRESMHLLRAAPPRPRPTAPSRCGTGDSPPR